MGTLDGPCDRCGATAVASPGQDVVGDRLAWSVSVRCTGCGAAEEICGWDDPPDEVREAILASDGPARLSGDPDANRPHRVAILRVLRRDGRSLDAAAEAYALLTGTGLTGTGAELRLLAGRLTAAGATVTLS